VNHPPVPKGSGLTVLPMALDKNGIVFIPHADNKWVSAAQLGGFARKIVEHWMLERGNAAHADASFAQAFIDMIHTVENRCMAADGPVIPTCDEITDDELRKLYVAAKAVVKGKA
jgi:hypothetical protein